MYPLARKRLLLPPRHSFTHEIVISGSGDEGVINNFIVVRYKLIRGTNPALDPLGDYDNSMKSNFVWNLIPFFHTRKGVQ